MPQKSASCRQPTLREKFGTLNDFLARYNPDMQVAVAETGDQWLTKNFPTLAQMKRDYGETAPTQWLMLQLQNLSEYCGCRDKFSVEQCHECARVIQASYYYLKISELLRFFFDMKAGKYGKFYGALDPMVVTTSLCEFIDYRNSRLVRIEQEEAERKRAEDTKNAITHDEYLRRKAEREKDHHADADTREDVPP